MTTPPLILASQSPRRKVILESLGLTFSIQPAHVDETPLRAEAPLAYVRRVARAKAVALAGQNPGHVVVAADTPIICRRRIIQSPATRKEAHAMLRAQSNRRVHIPTAVCVVDARGKVHEAVSQNWVKLRQLTDAEIEAYLANDANWKGIAGALQIEHPVCQTWIPTVHGSHSGILGLPVYETVKLLKRAGITC
ncbi:MAG: septum formation protein Maf [Pseudomonadaceae bacterium]|nr:septum formation protein Maf [Pseudomonadaceae bacterium]